MNDLELINMIDDYETRNGNHVRILAIDTKRNLYPVVTLVDIDGAEHVVTYTIDGLYCRGEKSEEDLIKVSKYKNWEIDCKVLAKDSIDKTWSKKHYAGLSESGKPTSWMDGKTSWSSASDVKIVWDEMKLFTGDDDETVQDD